MKRLTVTSIILLFFIRIHAQFYPFDSIPDNLKRGADAVVRTEQCLYTVDKNGSALMKVRKAITLLNEEAEGYRLLAVPYDKFSKVNYVKGAVFDEKGKTVRSMGFFDLFDISAITGGSFYSDDRMKMMYFPVYRYPYTIEYEYEISFSSIISYPTWNFQESPDVSVQNSGIQFVLPLDGKLRYYESGLRNKVDSMIIDDLKIFTWQERNIPATRTQLYSNKTVYVTPVLYTAPGEFEYGGITGSMRSWKEFGEWFYTVNKDRDELQDDEVNTIKKLTSGIQDVRQKTRTVYEYVQANTRYVSIQLGIGGLRTAEASDVAKNGFGDCKALVNYTKALLRSVGIESYYSLVKMGGTNDINASFVDQQFNHVILCVPVDSDTIWLDCTSQTLPFNYLGDVTSGRYALLITSDGGKLVRTPDYSAEKNTLSRKGTIYMNIFGETSGRLVYEFSGYYYDFASSRFLLQSDDEKKQYLYSSLRYPDCIITEVNYLENKSEIPSSTLDCQLGIKGLGTPRGDRIYFVPSVIREDYLPSEQTAIRIRESDIVKDSIVFVMPLGFYAEYLPEPVKVENKFGSYSFSLDSKDDKIIFTRNLSLRKAVIPTEEYDELRDFINTAAWSDRQIIILARKRTE